MIARLLLPVVDDGLDFAIAHKAALDPDRCARVRREKEHITLAQELLGAHRVQDDPRIDA
jgi:hypothetical protein